MRGLLFIPLALSLALCPAICGGHMRLCAAGQRPCAKVPESLTPACPPAPRCCSNTLCSDETREAEPPADRPALPPNHCCDDGNCLCAGALIAKIGVELHAISDFIPLAAADTDAIGIASLQNLAAKLTRNSAVPGGGTSMGRALRLRFESLLI